MKKVIILESDLATGEVAIETVGYKGAACAQATAAFEKALGTVKGVTKKPEYFQSGVSVKQSVGGGQ